MAFHIVILHLREVLYALIEGNGQFGRWIDVAKQDIGNGGAAFLPGIPGLEDGAAALSLRHKAHGAAGEIHKDNLLSGGFEGFQKLPLNGRKFNVSAVSALEAGDGNGHFLALETGRDAAGEDYDIGITNLAHDILFKTVHNAAALDVIYTGNALLKGLQKGCGMVWNGVVVTPHHLLVIGIGAHNCNAFRAFQGEDSVVLQKDYSFFGHPAGESPVLRAFNKRAVKIIPWGNPVHLSKEDALRKYLQHGTVKVFRCQKPLRDCVGNVFIGHSALYVYAVFHGHGSCFGPGFHVTVTAFHVEIVKGPAVRHYHPLIPPLSTEYVIHKVAAGPAGNAPEAVVGGHDLLHAGLCHKVLESGKIGFTKVSFRYLGIKMMTVLLRAGMHRKVFCAGVEFLHRGLGIPLQASHHRHAHNTGEIRVFTVCLHTAAPARVTEDVYIGCPEGKTLIPAAFGRHFVLYAGFVAHYRENLLQKGFVKGCSHSDGHREHRCRAVTGNPVKGLVPPVVAPYPKALHRRGIVHHK